jgi:hypothetical protein
MAAQDQQLVKTIFKLSLKDEIDSECRLCKQH